jgi:hypothetical protein
MSGVRISRWGLNGSGVEPKERRGWRLLTAAGWPHLARVPRGRRRAVVSRRRPAPRNTAAMVRRRQSRSFALVRPLLGAMRSAGSRCRDHVRSGADSNPSGLAVQTQADGSELAIAVNGANRRVREPTRQHLPRIRGGRRGRGRTSASRPRVYRGALQITATRRPIRISGRGIDPPTAIPGDGSSSRW